VISLVVLAGCMAPTMNEARQGGPYKVLASKKSDSVIAVQDCSELCSGHWPFLWVELIRPPGQVFSDGKLNGRQLVRADARI